MVCSTRKDRCTRAPVLHSNSVYMHDVATFALVAMRSFRFTTIVLNHIHAVYFRRSKADNAQEDSKRPFVCRVYMKLI